MTLKEELLNSLRPLKSKKRLEIGDVINYLESPNHTLPEINNETIPEKDRAAQEKDFKAELSDFIWMVVYKYPDVLNDEKSKNLHEFCEKYITVKDADVNENVTDTTPQPNPPTTKLGK